MGTISLKIVQKEDSKEERERESYERNKIFAQISLVIKLGGYLE